MPSQTNVTLAASAWNLSSSTWYVDIVAAAAAAAIAAGEMHTQGFPRKLNSCACCAQYSLGHSSVMRSLDKGLKFLGCGAYHASVEVIQTLDLRHKMFECAAPHPAAGIVRSAFANRHTLVGVLVLAPDCPPDATRSLQCHGVEWSYGFNDEDESGLFSSPPKFCDMHGVCLPAAGRVWLWLHSFVHTGPSFLGGIG